MASDYKKVNLATPGLVAASSQVDYPFQKANTAIARSIEGASTIDEQRRSFDQLYELMFALVKTIPLKVSKYINSFARWHLTTKEPIG